jgi:class 3 adenylate cyclase
MDGYALCQALKADPHLIHIPVILLTARASEDMKIAGLEIGADDYLSKPFNARELMARIHNLLIIRRQERTLKRFNETLEQQVQAQLTTILRSKRLSYYIPGTLIDRLLASDQPVTLTSERKHITIFFSDLVGFTELSDRLEPERITPILNEYLTEMIRLIERHRGTLARFMGDGLMVFFGTHDDMTPKVQAEQAVAMGVAMHRAMGALNTRWTAQGIEAPLHIRMGIAQDYATVGNFGSPDLMEYTAIGGCVNLAKRLEAGCDPGRIRIDHRVYAQTKERFPYADLGTQDIRGFAYPVRIYEVDPKRVEG